MPTHFPLLFQLHRICHNIMADQVLLGCVFFPWVCKRIMTGLAREYLFWKGKPERRSSKVMNLRTLIPEAIVASTFPLVFFFSLLYYTDVASLGSVLLCYSLGREKKYLASSIVSAFVDLDHVWTRSDSAYDKSRRQALYPCGSGKRMSSGSDSRRSRQPWTYWKSGSDSIVNSLGKCPTSARVG
jgi:hypothetical protein